MPQLVDGGGEVGIFQQSNGVAARHKCAACLPLQKALLLDNILSGQYTGLNPVSPPIGKSPSLRQGSPDCLQGFLFAIYTLSFLDKVVCLDIPS